jgi:hypothetical protein
MATQIDSPEDLQKFLDQNNLRMSAILEGYELAKAKLAKAEQDYRTLAQMHNDVVEENKKLKEELNATKEATGQKPNRKRAAKK